MSGPLSFLCLFVRLTRYDTMTAFSSQKKSATHLVPAGHSVWTLLLLFPVEATPKEGEEDPGAAAAGISVVGVVVMVDRESSSRLSEAQDVNYKH